MPVQETWTVLRTGPSNPSATSPFTESLDDVIQLLRTCTFDEAASASEAIRDAALRKCDHEAVGRASSFLGEIAGIRGDLDSAMREFGIAIEHLEYTHLAGSIARAYRGLAYCNLLSRMPNLALAPALEALRLAGLSDVESTKDRAEFESHICLGFAFLGLTRLDEARAAYCAAERRVEVMSAVDAWLPGLFEVLGGRLDIAMGRLTQDDGGIECGISRLEEAAAYFERAGLIFWEAFALDSLARALVGTSLDSAIGHMAAATEIYRRIGAARLREDAEGWIETVRPFAGTRYSPPSAKPQPRVLSEEVSVVSDQLVAGQKTRLLFEKAIRYAEMDHPVLILGESGTGKEGLARIIHENSARSEGPFVPINCATVPEQLLESVLFGHRRGSFTGASDNQIGIVKSAQGGTLFLDEVGELPATLQPKLLRFLETRKVLRLGDTSEVGVDVRIVAATNQRLDVSAREARFRQDLYYRLNVLRLEPLPLRLRKEEVPALAQYLAAAEGASLTAGAITLMMVFDWPGNVRQLANVVSRARAEVGAEATLITRGMVAKALSADIEGRLVEAVPPRLWAAALGPRFNPGDPALLSGATVASTDELPLLARDYPFMRADGTLPAGMTLGEAELKFQVWQMARAFEHCEEAKSQTARHLGMNLQTFLCRARKHGLIKESTEKPESKRGRRPGSGKKSGPGQVKSK